MNMETLFVTIKADTKGVKDGTKQAKKSTDEFKNSLKDANTNTEKLTESFTSLVKSVASFVTVGLSASALFKGLEGAASYTSALAYQSDQLGLNIDDLQAYDQALGHFGGKQGEYAQNMRALHEFLGAPPEIIQEVELPQIADMFSKLNQQQKMVVAGNMHITASFAQMLSEGSKGVEKLLKHQRELGLPTREEGEKFKELNDHILDASNSLRYTFQRAVLEMAPTIERFLDLFIKGMKEIQKNPEAMKAALMTIAAGFAALGAALILANIEFVGIAASIGIIIAGIEKLVPLIKEFAAFEDSRKESIQETDKSWRSAFFGNNADENKNNPSWVKAFTNPINYQTSSAIANNSNQSTMNNDNSFRMSDVTVVTQAPDAQKMFDDLINKRFGSKLWQTTNTFLSGELI